jgi:hypothetical protein
MKNKKTKFIIEQIIVIVLLNYSFLIVDGFIYKTHWLPTFAFAVLFFNAGTFTTLYATIRSKLLTKEKAQLLFDLNIFIYLSFIGLLIYHDCHVATNNMIFNYWLGIYILINVIIFLFESYSSYKNYKASLSTNI